MKLLRLKSTEKADALCRADSFTEPRTTLEAQMTSLRTKGFLRPYRPYTPPPDLQVTGLQLIFSTDKRKSVHYIVVIK